MLMLIKLTLCFYHPGSLSLISDRPSVSIGMDFFWYNFHNGEGLERSDSESDTKRIG